ncbi:unnamed protein product (macronuclear) [Paramecium tetraurelia]|uniref:Xaa-Pro dipeptidase n=1 Tax=Paramecium tetraurelia TaxID=5888 RepID=A0CRF9_PARTE|nr:uncharacterized protein GSPATT00009691001 [Paramecium tetraurelia]CAK73376.1 unnamed protein product [Paramecium tetraurelia]|eukprot:XP_001440773.1 hypothetical protein (macronuclear) [Paramecium tetraurelia strain d4-2]
MDQNPIPLPKEYPVPHDFHSNLRKKFLDFFKKQLGEQANNSIVFLKGAESIDKHDDDQQYRVEQESNFKYIFGCDLLDCYGILEVESGKVTVFVPKYPESYKMWMVVFSNEEIKEKYRLDDVLYVDQLEQWIEKRAPSKLFIYKGQDSDSKLISSYPQFPYLSKYKVDEEELYWTLNECRVTKTDQEIEILRYVALLASESHENVMRKIRVGNKEYQMEALFKYHNFVYSGCRFTPYECICASGTGGSTLHYIENDKTIEDKQLILTDMGARYYGYNSDITVTFPSNGKFDEKQSIIYNAVLDAQRQVFASLKVGVNWGDMHFLAERVIVQHLLDAGLLVGTIEELMQNRIGKIFFCHGLGHLLGMRTHDVGGYNKGCPPRIPELQSLRFRRDLEVGMVFSNEPGIYFVDFIIQEAFKDETKARFLNQEKISEFMYVGGVRLEDDIALTANGPEILNLVPRSIAQVEACIRGEDWKLIQ